jgi:ketosteroid isomerase-like protein
MSQENIEVVRQMFEAFIGRDYDASLHAFASDAIGDFTHMMDGRIAHGRDEIAREVARWAQEWTDFQTSIESYRATGEEVLVFVRQVGTGRLSGITSELAYAQVFVVEAGEITRMKTYLDRAEALEAAGLQE